MPATPTTFVPNYEDLVVQLMGDSDNEYAVLKTLHGPYGKWEHYRVALVRSLVLDHRTRPPVAGATNWTDKLLEAAAHNDPRYRRFLDEGTKQAIRFNDLVEQRGALQAQANGQTFAGAQ